MASFCLSVSFPSDLSFQSTFPVRDELLSDLSDDDVQLAAKTPEVRKHTVISFKHKDDTDLFGLGIQEEAPAAKDSSEEQEGNSLIISKQEINIFGDYLVFSSSSVYSCVCVLWGKEAGKKDDLSYLRPREKNRRNQLSWNRLKKGTTRKASGSAWLPRLFLDCSAAH